MEAPSVGGVPVLLGGRPECLADLQLLAKRRVIRAEAVVAWPGSSLARDITICKENIQKKW